MRHQSLGRDGLTLIELIVVALIIGLLAMIALPTFLGQRERSRASAVDSDLRNAAVQIMAYSERTGGEVPADWDALVGDAGHVPSRGVSPEEGAVIVYQPSPFCLSIAHSATPENPRRLREVLYRGIEDGAC